MVFAVSQGPMPALSLAFPDVCLTPAGPAVVPVPYPNIAVSMMGIPTQFRVLHMGMPAHNMATITPMTNGDNAGVLLNPLSGMVMGPSRHQMGSTRTLVGGLPATRMLSPTGQNGASPGAFGTTLSPSQVKVLMLS